jgi:hypothetical protein
MSMRRILWSIRKADLRVRVTRSRNPSSIHGGSIAEHFSPVRTGPKDFETDLFLIHGLFVARGKYLRLWNNRESREVLRSIHSDLYYRRSRCGSSAREGPGIPCLRIVGECIGMNAAVRGGDAKVCEL